MGITSQAAAHRAAITASIGDLPAAIEAALASLVPSLAGKGFLAGTPAQIVDRIDWRAFREELAAVVAQGGARIAAAAIKSSARYIEALDLSPERLAVLADRIAAKHAAEFVTAISDSSRKALQETIRKSMRIQGIHKRELARDIRRQIGLNLPQQRSLSRKVAEWRELVEAGKMTPAGMRQRADRLSRRYRLQRSELIAGHESRTLTELGQRAAYREAGIVGANGVFVARNGDRSAGPPRHVRCDCTTSTVVRDGELRIIWVAGPVFCQVCAPFNGVLKGEGKAPPKEGPKLTGRRRKEIARLKERVEPGEERRSARSRFSRALGPARDQETFGALERAVANAAPDSDEWVKAKIALREAPIKWRKAARSADRKAILQEFSSSRSRLPAVDAAQGVARAEFDDALDFLRSIANRDLPPSIGLEAAPQGVSYYAGDTVWAGGTYIERRVMVHELGHWLEEGVPGLHRRAKAFWTKRTKGQEWEIFAKDRGLGEERFKPGNFLSKYMGKMNEGNSELISMGLELLYSNPRRLLQDKEYLEWLLGALGW